MKNDYTLVQATRRSHVDGILALTEAAFLEGIEKSLPMNLVKMRSYVESLVTDTHQLSVVAMVNKKPVGVVLGEVGEHAYCDGLVASDICIYVAPSHRGTECAKDLVAIYVDWCDRIPNLIGSTLGISQIGPTTPYLEKLYKDSGYKKSGLSYSKITEGTTNE